MEYGIGIALALIVVFFARATGLDRDRAFYPTLVIVVASYYVLFAVMGGSGRVLSIESIATGGFVLLAVLGFKRNLWFAVAGLCAHGVFDAFHDRAWTNPGVPAWWPAFCLAFDVSAGCFLAWLLARSNLQARPKSKTG